MNVHSGRSLCNKWSSAGLLQRGNTHRTEDFVRSTGARDAATLLTSQGLWCQQQLHRSPSGQQQ
ncbi:hypothetical protein IG631_03915 [Alternaria alternata]|nr:hypothetical protein IG631_03915 [Alternaria alternata]